MAGNRRNSRMQSGKMAFCGMLVALAMTVMLSGGLIPVATYCAPMFAAILLMPVLLEYGRKAAWTAFAAVAIMALVIDADKEAAFFFLFVGYYPIVKWSIEKIRGKLAKWIAKIALFNVSVVLMYVILGYLMNMEALIAEFSQMGTIMFISLLVLYNAAMILFDFMIMPLVVLYAKRIRPRLKFLMC